jgi:hypothetical protein
MRGRRCKRCYRRRYGHRDRGTSETHNVPPQLDTLDRVLGLRGCAPADGFAAPLYPWRLRRAPLVACQQNYNRFRGQAPATDSARLAAGIGTSPHFVALRNLVAAGAWRTLVKPAPNQARFMSTPPKRSSRKGSKQQILAGMKIGINAKQSENRIIVSTKHEADSWRFAVGAPVAFESQLIQTRR